MIICYIVLIDVVDMWVYRRFFFSAVVVYLADFTCIVYGECICNQGVCDIDCVIYKFFCKVCDGRWNNRCPKIRGILASCLWSVYFSFWEKIFFLRVLDAPNWYELYGSVLIWVNVCYCKCERSNFFCIVWVIQMFVSTFPSSGRHKHQHDAD